ATHFSSRRCPSSSQRPVRMIVSDDMPLASTPLSTVISGATSPGITVDSQPDITSGSVLTSRLECTRRLTSSTAGSVGMRIHPSAGNYDTVGSVMKADPSSVDKYCGRKEHQTTSAARRPRDPRIDAAILRATADLLVEIGYSSLTMAAVAERAGTTKTALYRRWSSKAELVHEAAFPTAPTAIETPPGDIAAAERAPPGRQPRRHQRDDRRRPRRIHQPRGACRAAGSDCRHDRRRRPQ